MKFSVLLPTRNRLEYLRYAIETVRRQDYSEWEIIVSDNHSEEDISGYINSLGEVRIRCVRTKSFVPVTDNWNNALAHCTGDYVVMLGDDDGLMPGYFSRLVSLFHQFPDPDYVYLGGYFFAYGGAVSEYPNGFLRLDSSALMLDKKSYWLDSGHARRIASGYLNFKMPIASNMQFSLVSRKMVNELSKNGPFFRSPYPDFYATPLLFLKSKKILICTIPLVFVGISKKSYGAYHFDGRTSAGMDFLGNTDLLDAAYKNDSLMLPGTKYYDSWLMAMRELEEICQQPSTIKPNLSRYRFLQILHVYKGYYSGVKFTLDDMSKLHQRMTLLERAAIGPVLATTLKLLRRGALLAWLTSWMRSMLGQHQITDAGTTFPPSATLIDAYEFFAQSEPL